MIFCKCMTYRWSTIEYRWKNTWRVKFRLFRSPLLSTTSVVRLCTTLEVGLLIFKDEKEASLYQSRRDPSRVFYAASILALLSSSTETLFQVLITVHLPIFGSTQSLDKDDRLALR